MNWNSKAPMELLSHMPPKLSKDNLKAIQAVIDNDKLICSTMLKRDLCGSYAPFCALCDRSMSTPCAVAYLRMKQAEGIQLEIAVSDEENEAQEVAVPQAIEEAPAEIVAEQNLESVVDEGDVIEAEEQQPAEEPVSAEPEAPVVVSEYEAVETVKEPEEEPVTPKRTIRIAIAKRKKS